jgi:hypothetical protein
MQFGHCRFIFEIAVCLASLSIENFDGLQIHLLPLGGRLCQAQLGSGCKFAKYLLRGSSILFVPHRMILCHSLVPVGHGEIGGDSFRSSKMPGSVVVFEIVELR